MRLRIVHRTTLSYEEPISEAYTEVRLRPQDVGGQHCLSFRLTVDPPGPTAHQYVDRFGNDVRHFDVLEPHDRLAISAESEVITSGPFRSDTTVLSALDSYDFLATTAYVPVEGPSGELGRSASEAGPYALMHETHQALTYERGSTHVHTTADEALELGRGVCQDFAHVLIAACRARGIPARYVSGYLYDPKHQGGDAASHAWVDVFVGGRGWMSLDPTHDREQDEHYVRVGVGRDYADVPPTRGVYWGNAPETLAVGVTITA